MNKSIYILVKQSEATPRLVNLSTSPSLASVPSLPDGRLILEFGEDARQDVVDHTWYTADDIGAIRADLEAAGAQSKWWHIF